LRPCGYLRKQRASTLSRPDASLVPLCLSQAAYLYFRGCQFPSRITITYAIYIISLFVLFTNFDRKTYKEKTAKKE
jgi:hypothetical protein